MTIFGREPAFWIGVIGAVAVAVIQTLAGQGVISDVAAGKTIDTLTLLQQLLTILVPVIAGLVIRTQVTPVAAPALPSGTKVTVITPPANPNTTTTV